MLCMSVRKVTLDSGEYYHIYNRGVDKRVIFQDVEDSQYFLDRLCDFNSTEVVGGVYMQNFNKYKELRSKASKLVEIVSYCLLPNHYHILLKANTDEGVSKFMHRVGTGYSKYFNKKYQRSGALFQGKFQATHISMNDTLPFMSVYVNLNYQHHKIDPEKNIVKTSFFEYIEKYNFNICNYEEVKSIVNGVGGIEEYKAYAKIQSLYFKERKEALKIKSPD